MRIVSTKNIGTDAIKMLVFGESGSGKTYLAGTIKDPTLVISAESGLLTLADKEIDTVDISKNDKGEMIPKEKRIERLSEVFVYLTTEEAKKKYKVIYIDSLSEISQCLIDALKVAYPSKSDSLKMYGENADKMRSLIKSFRDLPGYSVIMTALAVAEKDENGRRYMGVDLVGKISDQINQYMDEVFFLTVMTNEDGSKKRVLVTGKDERVSCKDRSGRLEFYEPADLDAVFKKIKGEKNATEKGKK